MTAEPIHTPRVAFLGALARSFAEPVRARLSIPCEIVLTDEPQVLAELARLDVLVSLVFTASMGAESKRLRLLQVPGAGLDRVDRNAVPAGVLLANAYGHEAGIAEFVLGALIALERNFIALDRSLRRGLWESQWGPGTPPPPARELAGRTLAILGYGGIGRALARRAAAFDMKVLAVKRHRSEPEPGVRLLGPEALDDVLAQADHVAITLPLTPATRGLIGARELGLMKPTASLFNVARAEIVDAEALYRALRERRIAGAALDVWYRYPQDASPSFPALQPFHELPNLLMTPHVAGWSDGMMRARADVIAANIARVMRGETPVNLVNFQGFST
jgi:phosphoglycerate dehydrogenase-like enzyme